MAEFATLKEQSRTGHLKNSFSYFDVSDGEHPERVYHAFILGLLVNLQATHEVTSNRESGYGLYDVMIIPKNPAKLGIILEFKRSDSEAEMASDLDKALAQIDARQYASVLHTRGIQKILKLGVVFWKKKVSVKAG